MAKIIVKRRKRKTSNTKILKTRQAQRIPICGTNGTGKSTYVKELIQKMNKRAIVFDYSGHAEAWQEFSPLDVSRRKNLEEFEGIKRWAFHAYEEDTFSYLWHGCKNTVLVFDDCKNYISNTLSRHKFLKRLLVDSRHLNLDLIFVVHSVNDLPVKMWANMSRVVIFATTELLSRDRMKFINNANHFLACQKEVNQKFRAAKDGEQYGIKKIIKL